MKLILRTVLIIGLAVGCAPPPIAAPPIAAPPIAPARINASFGKTWDVVIDYLSADNVPITTLDKASGYVITGVQAVRLSSEDVLADCGGFRRMRLSGLSPMIGRYNIVVRGDSTTSTVTVKPEFTKNGMNCPSKNAFETKFQSYVKARAEAR